MDVALSGLTSASASTPPGLPSRVAPEGPSAAGQKPSGEPAPPETSAPQEVETPGKEPVTEPVLRRELSFANAVMQLLDKKIAFNYDERIDRVVVKVVRDSTEEVIRQIPPEEMIELVARFRTELRGLLFNSQG